MWGNMTYIFFFLLSVVFLSLWSTPTENGDELPKVKMTFINNSRFPIHIHFYNHDTLVRAQLLKPNKTFEPKVDHGMVIHLEYAPPPHKTVLKAVDSLQQISRTITFSNDGEHIRIKEKFLYTEDAKIESKKKKRKRKPEDKDGSDS